MTSNPDNLPEIIPTPDENTDTVRHCERCGRAVLISKALSEMTGEYTCAECRGDEAF